MSNTSGISDLPESPLNRLLGLHEREVSDLLQKYGVHTPSNPPLRPNTNTSSRYTYPFEVLVFGLNGGLEGV